MPKKIIEECQVCKFCLYHEDFDIFQCRRYPPIVKDDNTEDDEFDLRYQQPFVGKDGWCGEFKYSKDGIPSFIYVRAKDNTAQQRVQADGACTCAVIELNDDPCPVHGKE